jgi:hypothetical protein
MISMSKTGKLLGKLSPRYVFFLNPYDDLRFSRCPRCKGLTRSLKLPLVIWVEPKNPVALNYTCRYCPADDLLIAHQNVIEDLLARIFEKQAPHVIGNDYLVLGTLEKSAWKQGSQKPNGLQKLPEYLHDFREVIQFDIQPGWVPQDAASNPATFHPLPKSRKPSPAERHVTHPAHIDDESEAMALMGRIKISLPIPARPSRDLVKLLSKKGILLDRYRDVQIKDVHYLGDEGGIMCDITPADMEKTPILCSITHLLFHPEHPLSEEIRAYQKERNRKLKGKPGSNRF